MTNKMTTAALAFASLMACAHGSGVVTDPSCTDSIQNQGETDVDCGGPCSGCIYTCTEPAGLDTDMYTNFVSQGTQTYNFLVLPGPCAGGFFTTGTPTAVPCTSDGPYTITDECAACTAVADAAADSTITCTSATNTQLTGACDVGYSKVKGTADLCTACTGIQANCDTGDVTGACAAADGTMISCTSTGATTPHFVNAGGVVEVCDVNPYCGDQSSILCTGGGGAGENCRDICIPGSYKAGTVCTACQANSLCQDVTCTGPAGAGEACAAGCVDGAYVDSGTCTACTSQGQDKCLIDSTGCATTTEFLECNHPQDGYYLLAGIATECISHTAGCTTESTTSCAGDKKECIVAADGYTLSRGVPQTWDCDAMTNSNYGITETLLGSTTFDVTLTCATGFVSVGTPTATVCNSFGGAYGVTNPCQAPATCTETAIPAVVADTTKCDAVTALDSVTACEAVVTTASVALSPTVPACTFSAAENYCDAYACKDGLQRMINPTPLVECPPGGCTDAACCERYSCVATQENVDAAYCEMNFARGHYPDTVCFCGNSVEMQFRTDEAANIVDEVCIDVTDADQDGWCTSVCKAAGVPFCPVDKCFCGIDAVVQMKQASIVAAATAESCYDIVVGSVATRTWCQASCSLHVCPEDLCQTVQCGAPDIATSSNAATPVSNYGQHLTCTATEPATTSWCQNNCGSPTPHCPPEFCECN